MLRVMQALSRFLDGHLRPQAGVVVGKFSEQAEQRNAELLRPGLEMAIAAGEIVAGKALGAIRNFGTEMGVGRRDEVAPLPHQTAIGIVWERADLGHRPDRWARLGLLRRARRHPASLRPSQQPQGRQRGHTDGDA
jgi:hypothetical protein